MDHPLGAGMYRTKLCTIAGVVHQSNRMLLLMKFLPSLKMMRWLRRTQIWPEGTQISASPSGKDLVRRKTAELSEICCSFPRDERWGLELKTWQMKCWETYSCWTQISASPWWRRGWSTEWPTPVGPRSLRVHDGGGVHLDVKVEPPENECLSLRGEMSPEDSVTRWMDMVCRLQLYDIFYL